MSLYYCRTDCIIKTPFSEMKGMQEKESIMGVRDREKNQSSESQSDITEQASWCPTVPLRRTFLSTPHTHGRFL